MLGSTWRVFLVVASCTALASVGCGGDDDARVDAGGAPVDAAARDAGGGAVDAAARDSGSVDAGPAGTDGGALDAGAFDAGSVDGGSATADAGPRADGGTTTRPDGATMVAICGGLAGATCARTDFCDYPATSMCGAGDVTGVCMVRPGACTRIYDPVCGCDGADYSNPCMAQAAGTDVAYTGMCAPTADCRTTSCPRGETCSPCRGAGGAVWVCLPAGVAC